LADVDSNLVRAIAEQVLLALRGNTGSGGGVVNIHAPLGECTGDYSKFTDVKIQSAPAPVAVAQTVVVSAPSAPPAATVLKGVITVSHIRAIKGPLRIGKGAILTPLAQDYIRDKHIQVVSDTGAGTGEKISINAGTNSPTYWWIDGQCPSVAKVIEALRPNTLASRERSSPDNLRLVVKELATLVKNKKVTGALLFVNSAARAVCYANRCHSLRAIVGTSDKAVADGIEHLGANTLILEYPLLGFKSMMALVKPFIESLHQPSAAVQKELSELMTCG
jgi:hypothetical protein